MQPTPDTPSRLCLTLHRKPLERLDFRAGRVKKQLDLLVNAGDLETLEADNLVPVVDYGDCQRNVQRHERSTHCRDRVLQALCDSSASRQTQHEDLRVPGPRGDCECKCGG